MSELDAVPGQIIYVRAPNGTAGRTAGQIVWSLLDEDGTVFLAESSAGVTEPQAGTYQAAVTIPTLAPNGGYFVRIRDTVNGLIAETSVSVWGVLPGYPTADAIAAVDHTLGAPDGTGVLFAITGRTYLIRDAATGAAVALWADKAGTVAKANPIAVTNGALKFFVKEGELERVDQTTGAVYSFTAVGRAFQMIAVTQKGAANGVATLDATGHLPVAQLGVAPLTYRGVWDAATNTPALADGTGTLGHAYSVATGSTRNLGSGNLTFVAGDLVVHNGTIWQRSPTADVNEARLTTAEGTLPLKADRARLAVNAKDLGAIGDGASHTLTAAGYATLAAAQVDYPAATALTQQLDWAAIQKAIDTAAVIGGRVLVPRGTYVVNSSLTLKARVHLCGEAQNATILRWTVDLGAGQYAIKQPAAPGTQITAPLISDCTMTGPGYRSLGVQTANMDGIELGDNLSLEDGASLDFRAGLVMIGNHQNIARWKSSDNFYNVLYPSIATSKGNQSYRDCRFDGALFAAIAVEKGGGMDGVIADGVDLGFSPYGIYKFDGPAYAGGVTNLISQSQLRNVSFEAIGNGAILDESTPAGSADTFSDVEITYQGFSWATGYKIASRPAEFAVRGRTALNTKIAGRVYPFTAGSIAAFHFTATSSVEIDGHVVPKMFSATGAFTGVVVGDGRKWRGIVASAAVSVDAGHLVEIDSGPAVRPFQSGGSNRALYGVAMNTASVGSYVVVATDGSVQAMAKPVPHGGVYLTPDETAPSVLRPVSSVGNFGHPGTGTGTPNKFPMIAVSDTNGGAAGAGALMGVQLLGRMFDRAFVAPGAVTALPAAGASYRGQLLTVEGAAGVADTVNICQKNAADAYVWRAL